MLSLAALLAAVSCSSSPAAPATVPTVPAPQLMTPANFSQIAHPSQPITLVVQNAAGSRAGTTYTFEVATDVVFANKVQTKDGVAEGANGQTSVAIDVLGPGNDYFWRARAQAPGATGTFSDQFKFTLGPAVNVAAPVPISPLTNTETNPRPALRVTNAIRTGPTGAITYRFEIARDSGFSSIVVTATKAEGVNETGFIPTSDLPTRVLLYWRATASDSTTGLTSSPSAVQSFTALPFSQAESVANELGIVLWPGRTPPGALGHATMGDTWRVQTLYYAPGGVFFRSPDAEMIRLFDLLDRGFDPDGAAAWMNANGYPTLALWYPPPEKAVIGLRYVYLASRDKIFVNGYWEVVLRVE